MLHRCLFCWAAPDTARAAGGGAARVIRRGRNMAMTCRAGAREDRPSASSIGLSSSTSSVAVNPCGHVTTFQPQPREDKRRVSISGGRVVGGGEGGVVSSTMPGCGQSMRAVGVVDSDRGT